MPKITNQRLFVFLLSLISTILIFSVLLFLKKDQDEYYRISYLQNSRSGEVVDDAQFGKTDIVEVKDNNTSGIIFKLVASGLLPILSMVGANFIFNKNTVTNANSNTIFGMVCILLILYYLSVLFLFFNPFLASDETSSRASIIIFFINNFSVYSLYAVSIINSFLVLLIIKEN